MGIGKAGACATRPTACLGRWGECLLQGACEGTDPEDLLGLLPWLALIGIGLSGVLRAFRPPATRPYPREVPPSPTRPPTPTPTPTPAPPDRSDPRPRQGDQRHPPATDPGLGLDQQGRKLIPYADLFVIAWGQYLSLGVGWPLNPTSGVSPNSVRLGPLTVTWGGDGVFSPPFGFAWTISALGWVVGLEAQPRGFLGLNTVLRFFSLRAVQEKIPNAPARAIGADGTYVEVRVVPVILIFVIAYGSYFIIPYIPRFIPVPIP